MRTGQYALIAAAAESMYADGVLDPKLPDAIAADWQIVDYITGLDALVGAQQIGLGEKVFYGFLAQNIADPHLFVVAVRGTETALEWLIDSEAQPMFQHDVGGMVHAGFWTLYKSLTFKGETAAVGIAKEIADSFSEIFVVGHSLGSALATYLMCDLRIAGKQHTWGALFASPKPGDKSFATYVDTVMQGQYAVYNYSRDLVPHAPLTLPFLDYHQLNTVVRITPATAQAAIKHDPGCCHSALSYAAMLGEPVQSTCVIGSSP